MSNVPVIGGGSGGTSERVLEYTRNFGSTPSSGRWAMIRWSTAPASMNYSARVRIRIEALDSAGALVNTAYYNMWIQIDQASGKHAIKMLAATRPTNGGAYRWRVVGNTGVANQTNLMYENNTYPATVEQWRVKAWLDEECSPNPVDALTIEAITVGTELARWEETDPVQVKELGDLSDVNLTGVV